MAKLNNTTTLDVTNKMSLSVGSSTNDKNYFEELYPWRPQLHASDIWSETPPTALTPAQADAAVIANPAMLEKLTDYQLDQMPASNGQGYSAYTIPGNVTSPRLINFLVPQKWGTGYAFTLKDAFGTVIPLTSGAYQFDYANGIMRFNDTNTPALMGWATPLQLTAYRYIGATGGGGGGTCFENVFIVAADGDTVFPLTSAPVGQTLLFLNGQMWPATSGATVNYTVVGTTLTWMNSVVFGYPSGLTLKAGDEIVFKGCLATSGGVSTFLDLTDTPATYIGHEGQIVTVNALGTGLEFSDPPTSVEIVQAVYPVSNLKLVNVASQGNTDFPYIMVPLRMACFGRRVADAGEPIRLDNFRVYYDGVEATYAADWFFYGGKSTGAPMGYNKGNWSTQEGVHRPLAIAGDTYRYYDIVVLLNLGGVTNVTVTTEIKTSHLSPSCVPYRVQSDYNTYDRNATNLQLSNHLSSSYGGRMIGGMGSFAFALHDALKVVCPPKALSNGSAFTSMGFSKTDGPGFLDIPNSIRVYYNGIPANHIDYIYPNRLSISHPGNDGDWMIEAITATGRRRSRRRLGIQPLTTDSIYSYMECFSVSGFAGTKPAGQNNYRSGRPYWIRMRDMVTGAISEAVGPFGARVYCYTAQTIDQDRYFFYVPYFPGGLK